MSRFDYLDGKEEKFYDSSTNLVDSENDSRVSGNTSQSSRFKTGQYKSKSSYFFTYFTVMSVR